MAEGKSKYYVVWEGRATGVFDSWEECEAQVSGYPGARYKSYTSKLKAIEAYRGDDKSQLGLISAIVSHKRDIVNYSAFPEIRLDVVAVDGACAKNPGPMEYRCVSVATGEEIFHVGPLAGGTNNLGEYLALIHAIALLRQRGDTTTPIYTDSRTALSWLRRRHSNTTISATPDNARVRELLARADAYIATHQPVANPILKWDTERWGEIPADFGRK